jgi:hypothetical protein
MAALGAWSVGEPWGVTGTATILFAAATAILLWLDPDTGLPVKFPMNLSYALMSCATIGAVFTLAHGLKRRSAAARGATWLGRNWLIFFYVHFAIVFVLRRLAIGPAPVVWAVLTAGSIGATWLVVKASAPFSRQFKSPVAWYVPLALIVTAGNWPGLSPVAVSCLSGTAGVIFAAYYDTLAYVIVNLRSGWDYPAPHWRRDRRSRTPEVIAGASGLRQTLLRLAVILALLLLPEIVGLLTGTGTPLLPGR